MKRALTFLSGLGGGRAGVLARVVTLRVLGLTINLGTGVLTAKLLGPDGRGEQAALLVAPQFLSAISALGLAPSVIFNIKANPDEERDFVGCSMLLAIGAGVLAALIGWVILPLWLGQHSGTTVNSGRWLLLTVPFNVLAWALTGAFAARSRFTYEGQITLITSMMTLIALATLGYLHWLTPPLAAVCYLVPAAAVAVFFAIEVWRTIRPRITFARKARDPILRYGIRLYGSEVLGTLSAYLDQIVIVYLLDPAAVGLYAVALSLSRMLLVLQNSVTFVLFPTIAARSKDAVVDAVATVVRITTPLSVIAALGLSVVGPYALRLLYGEKFADATSPFLILLVETVVLNARSILYQAFSGTDRPGMVTTIEGIGVCASAVGMILFVPIWGVNGAATAVLVASTIRLIASLIGLRTVLRTEMPRLILGRSDVQWILNR